MREHRFYKTGSFILVLWSFIILLAGYNLQGITFSLAASRQAYVSDEYVTSHNVFGFLSASESEQRVVNVSVMERKPVIELTQEDYENLVRIVEAEAGGEDRMGKLLVANVILNRVADKQFPNTVTEVIFQQEEGVFQFSPIRDGRFYNIRVSEETMEAVNAALYGEDPSSGALYFMARAYADKEKAAWFDRNLTRLFSYGGHEFFC